MNKRFFITILVIMVAVSGALYSKAMAQPDFDAPPEAAYGKSGDCDFGKGPMGRMARVLDLTEAQQAEIRAIMESERATVQPLREQLQAARAKVKDLVNAETFDEAAVRSLLSAQEGNRTEMMVAKARARSRIHALLTTEQRELAKKLEPLHEGRHGKRKGF